jgi:HK97 family phage prohead protease
MSTASVTKDLPFKLEIKKDDSNLEFVFIKGIASSFGNTDRTGDVIEPGAFKKTIKKMNSGERQVAFLNQHRMDQPIGVVDSIKEVGDDVEFEGRLARENSIVKDMLPLLKMGALHSVSIGFNIVESDMDEDGLRTIKEIDLWELSIVTIPANGKAKITSVKKDGDEDKIIDIHKAEAITSKRDFERTLRDSGVFTRKAAEILTKRFKEDFQGEPENLEAKQGEPVDDVKFQELMEAIEKTKKSYKKED